MAKTARRHPGFLVGGEIGAVVEPIVINLTVTETADVTISLFEATSRCRILKASYVQDANATAVTTYTAQLKNGSVNLSSALDIKALGADTGIDFAGVPTADSSDSIIEDGELVTIVFDETGGTVTAPGRVALMLEIQLLE